LVSVEDWIEFTRRLAVVSANTYMSPFVPECRNKVVELRVENFL